jgi:DNA-binding CsgD family transcriptional regulator
MTETMIAPTARLALVDQASTDGRHELSTRAVATVAVDANDPMTRAGIVSQLRRSPDLVVVEPVGTRASVVVLVADVIDDAVVARTRELNRRGSKVVIVASRIDSYALLRVLRPVVEQLGFGNPEVAAPRGLRLAGLTPRERDVLTLVAEGLSTRDVAIRMAYSERTIKNVLQELTTRLQLRNRTQAVAYALRNGWI